MGTDGAATRLTWRDALATVLVVGIVVPYVGYLARGSMPFIHDNRAMAITALIIGVLAAYTGDLSIMSVQWHLLTGVAATLGAVTLGLGIAAAVTQNGGLLAAFIVAIAGMWVLATLRHAGLRLPPGHGHGTRTA
ncbi:MAG: hypothetical protein ACM3ML_08695 [Micromonosporaceae bacterium]